MPDSTPPRNGLAHAALAAAGIIWGTPFLFAKIALDELPVGHMLLYRFVIGSIAFVPVAWATWRPIPRADWPLLTSAAVLGVPVQFLVQFEGLARTTVSHASLMIAALPILLAAGAARFTRERLTRQDWTSLAVATAGAVLIGTASGDDAGRGATQLGDALVFLSLLATVAWILITKRLTQRHDAAVVSIATIWLGTTLLAAWTLGADGLPALHLRAGTWLALVAQGVLATAGATLLWNWGITRVPAGRAGVFTNLEPIVGATLGVTVLGETLAAPAIVGGVLVLAGAALVALRPAPEAARPSARPTWSSPTAPAR